MNASSVSLNAPPSPFRNVSTCGPETTREKSTLWATSPSESAAVTVTTVVPSGVPAEVVSVKIALHVGSHSGGLKAQDAVGRAGGQGRRHVRARRSPRLDGARGRACRRREVERGRRGRRRWRRRGRGGIERYRERGLRRRFARAVVDAVPVGRGQED